MKKTKLTRKRGPIRATHGRLNNILLEFNTTFCIVNRWKLYKLEITIVGTIIKNSALLLVEKEYFVNKTVYFNNIIFHNKKRILFQFRYWQTDVNPLYYTTAKEQLASVSLKRHLRYLILTILNNLISL